MLDVETKSRINTARDILVGKVPDPKSQVEQITIALIYKFMDDMDVESEELGGKRTFFVGEYAKYAWRKIFDPRQSGYELLNLYSEAIGKMDVNPGVPKLFRDIFKNAYLPYRDPETLKSFLKIINEFDYSHSEKLGDAFEYLLSVLGSQGDAGQFRTPRHIIDFMVEIVDPKKDETILDPACGTAGFLISSYKHIIRQNSSNYNPDEHNGVSSNGDQSVADRIISTNGYAGDKLTADDRKLLAMNIHGYDISPDMVRLSLVNMYLHGIKDPKIFEYDTLTSEDNWHHFSDVILANPPFMSPKGGIRPHKRFSVQSNRSEVLFVDYIAEHLTSNGRAAVIVPEGIIFQSGKAYKQLRKKLVEECLVGVISLPAGVFNPYAGVKTSILWLDKALAKKTDKLLFIKIENDGYDLGAQRRAIKNNDIPAALHSISEYRLQLDSRSKNSTESQHTVLSVTRGEVSATGDYNLSGEKYRNIGIVTGRFPHKPLADVCTINPSKAEIKDRDKNLDVTFLPMADVIEHQPTVNPIQIRKLGEVYTSYTYFGDNDVLLARVTPCFENGKAAIVKGLHHGIGFGSSEFTVLRASEKVLPYWLYLMITSDLFKRKGKDAMTGTGGLQRIPNDFVSSFPIPLPPVPIQEEIAAEIESYQKIIDGARQVVENYKPRIDIDPEWEMVELGEVSEINPKKSELKELPGDLAVSFVPMADINENLMSFNPKQTKSLREVIKSYTYFRDNDVLLARVTPCFENGKAGIAMNLKNGIGFGSSEYTVIRCKDRVLPTWIYVCITTDAFKTSGKLHMTGTGGLQRVPYDFISSYQIPVPDIKTQEDLINQIHIEQGYVESSKNLIQIYEKKIKDRIAKVWGE